MKHRPVRKLRIARETLRRLEGVSLQGVAGGATNERSICVCLTNQDSVCVCETETCITLEFTNCNLCVG